jgi:hypothetical protein
VLPLPIPEWLGIPGALLLPPELFGEQSAL